METDLVGTVVRRRRRLEELVEGWEPRLAASKAVDIDRAQRIALSATADYAEGLAGYVEAVSALIGAGVRPPVVRWPELVVDLAAIRALPTPARPEMLRMPLPRLRLEALRAVWWHYCDCALGDGGFFKAIWSLRDALLDVDPDDPAGCEGAWSIATHVFDHPPNGDQLRRLAQAARFLAEVSNEELTSPRVDGLGCLDSDAFSRAFGRQPSGRSLAEIVEHWSAWGQRVAPPGVLVAPAISPGPRGLVDDLQSFDDAVQVLTLHMVDRARSGGRVLFALEQGPDTFTLRAVSDEPLTSEEVADAQSFPKLSFEEPDWALQIVARLAEKCGWGFVVARTADGGSSVELRGRLTPA